MDEIEILDGGDGELTLRHGSTGHVFSYRVAAGDLVPGPVVEGPGPKDPGDVAADVHAAAKREARRRGLI